jgi:hypothetical protein
VKLRKQAPAKAAIVAGTAALFALFFALVRSEPRLKAQEQPEPTPAVDYNRFFAPAGQPSAPLPAEPVTPRVRTRAS